MARLLAARNKTSFEWKLIYLIHGIIYFVPQVTQVNGYESKTMNSEPGISKLI